jgi:hypothetical protein
MKSLPEKIAEYEKWLRREKNTWKRQSNEFQRGYYYAVRDALAVYKEYVAPKKTTKK